jgi:purine catabolism regulator
MADGSLGSKAVPLTVEAVLGLRSLRRGAPRVAAGLRNLRRPVRWVHASEGVHIASMLKGGELLLLTGMGISLSRREQRLFVATLDQRGVAGMVIELGQVLKALPQALVEECETRGLPLIELRREVPFVEVTEEIHAHLVNEQLTVLRRADELQSRFTRLLLDGASIPDIMLALAVAIGNPVLLEKSGEGVLYHATRHGDDMAVLATWELWQERSEGEIVACAVPAAGEESWGRLVALPMESQIDDFTRVALERAVALIAVALLRNREESLLTVREHGNYLTDLAAGRLHGGDSAAHAFSLGFDPGRALLLPLVAVPPAAVFPSRESAQRVAHALVGRTLRYEFQAHGITGLVGFRASEGDLLILLGLAEKARRKALADVTADLIRCVINREFGGRATIVAVGPAVADWEEVPAALRQTADVSLLVAPTSPHLWHDATIPDVQRLLYGLRANPLLHEFATARLEPLMDHDRRRVGKLTPTLEALVAHGWHKGEAARAMNLSRQAIYPQIRRIARLLNVDLDDPDTRLGLALAVRTVGGTDAPERGKERKTGCPDVSVGVSSW